MCLTGALWRLQIVSDFLWRAPLGLPSIITVNNTAPNMFVNGSGIIVSSFSINNLTVSGSLTVNASISLAPSSVLNVGGDLRISSGNAVAVGSGSQIDVVVGNGSSL